MQVRHTRFTTTNIDVKVNDQLRIDVTLEVGSVQQSIEVRTNSIQVETANTQLGDVIESKKMLALPLNGRSCIDLLGLQAGVAPDTAGTIGGDRLVSGILAAANKHPRRSPSWGANHHSESNTSPRACDARGIWVLWRHADKKH